MSAMLWGGLWRHCLQISNSVWQHHVGNWGKNHQLKETGSSAHSYLIEPFAHWPWFSFKFWVEFLIASSLLKFVPKSETNGSSNQSSNTKIMLSSSPTYPPTLSTKPWWVVMTVDCFSVGCVCHVWLQIPRTQKWNRIILDHLNYPWREEMAQESCWYMPI